MLDAFGLVIGRLGAAADGTFGDVLSRVSSEGGRVVDEPATTNWMEAARVVKMLEEDNDRGPGFAEAHTRGWTWLRKQSQEDLLMDALAGFKLTVTFSCVVWDLTRKQCHARTGDVLMPEVVHRTNYRRGAFRRQQLPK